jgi:HEAT repeat protein
MSRHAALVAILGALLAIASCVLVGTLLRHALLTFVLRARGARADALLPLLCHALSDPAARPAFEAALRPRDRVVLLPLLLQLALDLRGEERERVAAIAKAMGLAASECRRLRRGRGLARADAAKNLGLLRIAEALPELLHHLEHDRVPRVRIACAWAVGEIGGPAALRGLVARLDDAAPGVVRRAQEVLLDTGPAAVREIVRHARATASAETRRAAVELLGALRDPAASDLLLEWARHPDVELRTKVAKAAAAIADPRFTPVFRELLHDPAWPVRCQAATGLGAVGADLAVGELSAALGDAAWWVRFNAASALLELGAAGRAALTSAAGDAQPLRRDAARYVLQRAGFPALAA